MVAVDAGEPTSIPSGYGSSSGGATEIPMVSVIDAGAERALTRTVVGESVVRSGECLLPRAAAFVPSSQSILVSCLGSDAVVELDGRGVDPSRLERRRWSVPGGPTGIAVDDGAGRAVVWSQFTSKLSVVPLLGSAPVKTIDVAFTPTSTMTAEQLKGRALFHSTKDARISRDGRACASCHPDGREDAITWPTPAGPRQTIMLAGGRVGHSAPFGWSGDNATLKEHITETFTRLEGRGFTGPQESDLTALVAYVTAMRAPTPTATPLAKQSLVKRGQELFNDAEQGCGSCHLGSSGTDARAHKVGRMGANDVPIDTPSLRYVAGTAPYFHDGRFATLEELLLSPDHDMGKTLHLSRDDRLALVAYLETL
jgi:cytochrome c553